MVKNYFLFTILVLSIFISGCSDNNEEYIPKAKLDLSSNEISIGNGIYSEPLTVSVTKEDDDRTVFSFIIKFLSPNIELMKFTDLNNKEITNMSTAEQTMLNGDRISKEFKVWGKKIEGQGTVPYYTTIEVWYQDKKIDSEDLIIYVN